MSKLGSLYIALGEPEGDMGGCCETADWAADEIERLRAQNAELMEALGWYQKQAELCQKITKEGDTARRALDRDGGAYALAVISKARGES
jgi:hypothetical protein